MNMAWGFGAELLQQHLQPHYDVMWMGRENAMGFTSTCDLNLRSKIKKPLEIKYNISYYTDTWIIQTDLK